MRRILVTGSRDWTDAETIREALHAEYLRAVMETGDEPVLVHGHCPTGADAIADAVWLTNTGQLSERHPADWDRYGKAAGPRRNQEMVDLGAYVCLAFPLPGSRGTRHCMTAAERAGIPVRVFEPAVQS